MYNSSVSLVYLIDLISDFNSKFSLCTYDKEAYDETIKMDATGMNEIQEEREMLNHNGQREINYLKVVNR